jgi:hypothetical protein
MDASGCWYIDCVPRVYDVVNTGYNLETNVEIEIISDKHRMIGINFSRCMYTNNLFINTGNRKSREIFETLMQGVDTLV